MSCCSSSSLSARSLHHVIQGETFVVTHAIAGAQAGSGTLKTALSGGTTVDDFDVAVEATQVVYSFDTTGLDAGVYYFDLLVQDEDDFWTAVVRRAGLVVDPAM